MSTREVYGEYYYGHKISDYGIEHGYVDYGTLAKAFDAVLNNTIYGKVIENNGYWESYSGSEYYYEDNDGNWYTPDERDDRVDELEQEREDLQGELDENKEMTAEESERAAEIEKRIAEIDSDIDALQEEHYHEVFQYYIISDEGARILSEDTDEIVLYNEEYDINLWCVTHYGTAWSYVLTDIKCNTGRINGEEVEDC